MPVGPEILAKSQKAALATFDGRRLVVALLHALQHLLLAKSDLVLLKARGAQNLAQDRQSFVQIFGEQVQAHATLVFPNARVELCGQERQTLLQVFGSL